MIKIFKVCFIAIFTLLIACNLPVFAQDDENNDINIVVQTSTENVNVNGGSGGDESKILSAPHTGSHVEHHVTPRVFDPGQRGRPWTERSKYPERKLLSIEEIISLWRAGKFFFQCESFPDVLPANNRDVNLADHFPHQKTDWVLWSFMIEIPVNGFLDFGIQIAASIAKHATFTDRIVVFPTKDVESQVAGNQAGGGIGLNRIFGDTAAGSTLNFLSGKDQSRGFKVWQIEVKCFNQGPIVAKSENNEKPKLKPISNKNFEKVPEKTQTSQMIHIPFNGNGELYEQELSDTVNYLKNRWSRISQNGSVVEIIGLGRPGADTDVLENASYKTAIKIKEALYDGTNGDKIRSSLVYGSKVEENPMFIEFLNKKHYSAVVMIRVPVNE